VNTRLVIGPNASLTPRQALWFMASISVLGLGIAMVFTVLGFWLVLPFAGLELAALGAALWVSLRRNRYREVLCFEADQLAVEFGAVGVGVQQRIVWPRGWTRAFLERGAHRHDPLRLVLACSGQQLEIGRCLTDPEREQLCMRLKELLRPGWAGGAAGGKDRSPANTGENRPRGWPEQ